MRRNATVTDTPPPLAVPGERAPEVYAWFTAFLATGGVATLFGLLAGVRREADTTQPPLAGSDEVRLAARPPTRE